MDLPNNQYGAEAQDRWPDNFAESNDRLAKLNQEEMAELFARGELITKAIAEAFRDGYPASEPAVQEYVADHYNWICAFWTPNKDSYIGLGQMYVADPRFTDHYNNFAEGLAPYMAQAMEIYANSTLN